LYRYFVSPSSEFCRHNPFCCFSTSIFFVAYFVIDSVRKLSDALSYNLIMSSLTQMIFIQTIYLWVFPSFLEFEGSSLC